MDDIGERIRELRRPTFTQVDLAVAADVSVDVIRKLEQGRRQTASIGTLQRIARALDVGVADLLGRARPAPSTGDGQARVWAIRDALTSVDDIMGDLEDVAAPDLTELGRDVTYAWAAFWAGRYGPVASMLPRLLAEAQAATHAAVVGRDASAVGLAVQVHRLTASTLLRLDAADLGHVAAREALRLAAKLPDPLQVAAGRYTLGHVLIRQGRFVDAERVSVATAEACQPRGDASRAQLSVYGGLLLRGATAAAREGRTGAATDLLNEASAVAERASMDRTDYEVVFGLSNVVMQSADVAVVTEDYPAAMTAAKRMPQASALPLASRSRHLTDVAHAQVRLGHDQAAESTMLSMEQAAPDWTSHHRLPRLLVGELLTRGRPSLRLRALADRLHVRPDIPSADE
ncbi:MAG: helix-turn-helix domain-containing protein [Actinobacteria bacterium]|nr:helix-turn-helix domain-containing protein [Actinomycetota bacterium]